MIFNDAVIILLQWVQGEFMGDENPPQIKEASQILKQHLNLKDVPVKTLYRFCNVSINHAEKLLEDNTTIGFISPGLIPIQSWTDSYESVARFAAKYNKRGGLIIAVEIPSEKILISLDELCDALEDTLDPLLSNLRMGIKELDEHEYLVELDKSPVSAAWVAGEPSEDKTLQWIKKAALPPAPYPSYYMDLDILIDWIRLEHSEGVSESIRRLSKHFNLPTQDQVLYRYVYFRNLDSDTILEAVQKGEGIVVSPGARDFASWTTSFQSAVAFSKVGTVGGFILQAEVPAQDIILDLDALRTYLKHKSLSNREEELIEAIEELGEHEVLVGNPRMKVAIWEKDKSTRRWEKIAKIQPITPIQAIGDAPKKEVPPKLKEKVKETPDWLADWLGIGTKFDITASQSGDYKADLETIFKWVLGGEGVSPLHAKVAVIPEVAQRLVQHHHLISKGGEMYRYVHFSSKSDFDQVLEASTQGNPIKLRLKDRGFTSWTRSHDYVEEFADITHHPHHQVQSLILQANIPDTDVLLDLDELAGALETDPSGRDLRNLILEYKEHEVLVTTSELEVEVWQKSSELWEKKAAPGHYQNISLQASL
jgi:hypothetical protein